MAARLIRVGQLSSIAARSGRMVFVAPCASALSHGILARHQSTHANPKHKDWVGLIGDQDYFEKNKKLNRPLSKHLTIYQPQITSILSTFHRGTGAALGLLFSSGAIIYGYGFGDISFLDHVNYIRSLALPAPVIYSAKFLLAWPLTYHFLNGIRHLAWDVKLGLELKALYATGYFTFYGSLLGAGVLAAL